jgi:hypothetical protein
MCTVLNFIDVTHIRKMIQLEYQNMKIQLRESSVTHELIAPLRCIINLSDSLIGKCATPDETKIPRLIFNTAKLIHAQMNDILDN